MRARRRRVRGRALGAAVLVGVLLTTPARPPAVEPYPWVEEFRQGRLDPARWERTVEGDFREASLEVVSAAASTGAGYRLRLRADTRGTRDDTVKYLGARATQPIPLGEGREIEVDLDWARQSNGSYLTAAVVLSPHVTTRNPLDTADWLKVAYVGVPPGHNGRMLVEFRAGGRDHTVETEGWPATNREGRRLGSQRITLRFHHRAVEVWEGDRSVWISTPDALGFESAYLYLQMSSHSNYPPRAIYFDRVRID
jgi:hypothetical protein